MAVSTTHFMKTYNGNGVTTSFPIDFQHYTGEIVVYLETVSSGILTPWVISTNYTLIGGTAADGTPATGTLTALTAPATGTKLHIRRATANVQGTVHSNNDAFPAKAVESSYDKRVLAIQERMGLDELGWNAQSLRIADLAEAVDDNDAVTLLQMQEFVADTIEDLEAGTVTTATVNHTPLGTGAVVRTQRHINRERISVLDYMPTNLVDSIRDYSITTEVTAYFQAAINYAGSVRGKLIVPAGLYLVHLDSVDTNVSAYHVCALKAPYDYVKWEGDGEDASIIKCLNGGVYGAIQFIQTPLENGIPKIFESGLRHISVDGNYDQASGSSSVGHPLVLAAGLADCEFEHFKFHKSSHYGFGMQNGGFQGNRIASGVIENTNQDGIDVKNNRTGDASTVGTNTPNVFDKLTFRNCGRGTDGSFPFAALDVMGPGCQLSNINVESFPTDAGATVDAGVRVKQGKDDDSAGRGIGGEYAMLSNVYVRHRSGDVAVTSGIAIRAPRCSVVNPQMRGAFPEGLSLLQAATVHGGCADGAVIGARVRAISGSSNGWDNANGAEYASLLGFNAASCATGIKTERPETNIIAPILDTCATGIDFALSTLSGTLVGAQYKGCTIDLKFNGTEVASAKNVFIKDGVIARFRRNALQGMDLQADASANWVISYTDATAAKMLRHEATTDAAHAAVSGGAVGHQWGILGTVRMSLSSANVLNLITGATLAINTVQLLKGRVAGWTVASGTAQRAGFATYTAANISASPTEAEVQAIADALQDVSRTLKALIDDLHGTAGHGLIGT